MPYSCVCYISLQFLSIPLMIDKFISPFHQAKRCFRSGHVGAFVLTGAPRNKVRLSIRDVGNAGIPRTAVKGIGVWPSLAKISPIVQVSCSDNQFKKKFWSSRLIDNQKLLKKIKVVFSSSSEGELFWFEGQLLSLVMMMVQTISRIYQCLFTETPLFSCRRHHQ